MIATKTVITTRTKRYKDDSLSGGFVIGIPLLSSVTRHTAANQRGIQFRYAFS